MIQSIAVYCGSSSGYDADFMRLGFRLGGFLAKQNIRIIYGGARVGLMGALADGALEAGGKVIGVMPRFLDYKELVHQNLDELIWTEDMHERKHRMLSLADGVIALPGGFGTMEEMFEVLTWGQLGLHGKPVALLNHKGYYDHLLAFLDNSVKTGFLKQGNRDQLLVGNSPEEVLAAMTLYQAPNITKWIDIKPGT